MLALVVALTPFATAYANNDSTHDPTGLFSDFDCPVYTWCNITEKPRAIVLCFHGAVLHGRAFHTLGAALAERNYMTVSMDLRGYGEWYYARPPACPTIRYKQTINDIRSVLLRLRRTYPGTPIFCLGESLGASISLFAGATMPGLVDGVIAVSPVASVRRIVSRVCISPGWASLCCLRILANPCNKLDIKYYLARTLSNRNDVIAEHFADPFSRDRQSIAELSRTLYISLAARKVAKEKLLVPVLIVTGKEDKIVPPNAIRRLFEELPSRDKTIALETTSGHLMTETVNIQPVTVNIISRWIAARTRPALAFHL